MMTLLVYVVLLSARLGSPSLLGRFLSGILLIPVGCDGIYGLPALGFFAIGP